MRRICIGLLAFFLTHLASHAAQGAWLDRLGRHLFKAGESTGAGAAALLRKFGTSANSLLLELSESGAFRLTAEDGRVVASFLGSGDLVPALKIAAGQTVAVPHSVLLARSDIATAILEQPVVASLLTKDGLYPLRLRPLNGGKEIVVEMSPTLSFAADAFARRAALESISAEALLQRMHVIPLISRTDAVARREFDDLANLADPPTSIDAVLDTIRGRREKLLVITGHVEGDDFVVRSAVDGAEEYRVAIDDVYRAARASDSEVLLLGCNVACVADRTGPLEEVSARQVIEALASTHPSGTAVDLLRTLADNVGPLLIRDDHGGGFRVIEDADARTRARWRRAGTGSLRVVVELNGAPRLAQPWDPVEMLTRALALLLLVALGGWPALFLVGIGPRHGWQEIKAARAAYLRLEAAASVAIPKPVAPLYLVLGPWIVVNEYLVAFALLLAVVPITFLCAPTAAAIPALALLAAWRTGTAARGLLGSGLTLGQRYVVLVSPLVVGASVMVLIALPLDFPGPAGWMAHFRQPATRPLGIAIATLCFVYAAFLCLRLQALCRCSRAVAWVVAGWPSLLLTRLELRLLGTPSPRAA